MFDEWREAFVIKRRPSEAYAHGESQLIMLRLGKWEAIDLLSTVKLRLTFESLMLSSMRDLFH